MSRGAFLLVLLAALLSAGGAGAAHENHRALLVGVSGYPALDASLQLRGPANDVTRVKAVLMQKGFAPRNITELSENPGSAALPTRANILAQMTALARTAKPGDFIVVYMAGHGSQEPVPPGSPFEGDEPDGLFEIFLPRDVGAWTPDRGTPGGHVQNAILDHEIRSAVDRMTAAGAFVWTIFDACHSGSLVRSVPEAGAETRLRQVSPAALGIPDTEMERASRRRTAGPARPAPPARRPGRAVYFYATQSNEPTAEMPLPAGRPDAKPHGLFTYQLMAGIDGVAGITYRQLAQGVLVRYGGIGEARATPLFSGTALDEPVLGGAAAVAVAKQWRLTGPRPLVLAAGALAEVQQGSVFAILPSPDVATEQAIGYAQAWRIELASSELVPVAYQGKPAASIAALAKGSVARLVRPAMRFTLGVGVDLGRCAAACPEAAAIAKLREPGRQGDDSARVRIEWIAPQQVADVQLTSLHGRLWLLPPSLAQQRPCTNGAGAANQACIDQMLRSIPSVHIEPGATPEALAARLHDALHATARATNLLRIAASLGASVPSRQLETTIELVDRTGRRTPYAAEQASRVSEGDHVDVSLRNVGDSDVDVTALYLDSLHGIAVLFPGPGAINRLEPGATHRLRLDINSSTLGLERLAVIFVRAKKHGERSDFSFLAQPTLAGSTTTRGGEDNDVTSMFMDAGFAHLGWRGVRPAATDGVGMQTYAWQVVR